MAREQTEVAPYRYAPITSRPSWSWPDGKRVAVYVALGVESYRLGGDHTEDLLHGVPAPDLVNAAWRDYGNRVGAFRVLDRLGELGIPPTVLLNTDVYDAAPEVAEAARKLDAEFVGHGMSNSDSLQGMSPAEERAYLGAVAARIHQEEGRAPQGWSSPWLTQTTSTIESLTAAGYRYLLDLRADDQPLWLDTSGAPLLAIPYPLELNDSTSMISRGVTARDFADMIVDEFDELLEAADRQPVVLGIVVHSFISGAPFRLHPLTRALRHLCAQDAAWFTQPAAIADIFTAAVPPPPPPPPPAPVSETP